MKIKALWAREILDARGIPTIEAACRLDSGHTSIFSVPSGTSTGAYEALELRDGEENRFKGTGVLKAVSQINKIISPHFISTNIDILNQQAVDNELIKLDGTKNKSRLGANSILAVSAVICKLAALSQGMPLYQWVSQIAKTKNIQKDIKIPVPLFNMINGGLHGAGNLDFQEFLVIPASSKLFSEGLRSGVEIYMTIGENLSKRGAIHSVGHEGGYAPNLFTNADALEILVEAVRNSGYQMGRDIFLGLDVAATTFFHDNSYFIRDKSGPLSEDSLIEYYKELNNLYHFAILEDGLHEDSWEGWVKLRQILGDQLPIVGDDLLATNIKRVEKAIATGACNAILVKPNQIGTISETLDVIKKSSEANWKVIVSHRSGETNDHFIADFAVGVGADYVKFGAPARGERVAKYNRLLSIESQLNLRPKEPVSQTS